MPNGTPPIQPTQPKPVAPVQPGAPRPVGPLAGPRPGMPPAGALTRKPPVKVKKPATARWRATTNLISVVLIILAILAYGLMFFLNSSRERTITNLNNQIDEVVSDLAKIESQRLAAETLAAQLDNEEALLNRHVAWSELLKKLSDNTPRKVNFTEFAADLDGYVTVSGFAQTMSELAKLTQSLEDSPEFNDVNVSGVELTAVKRPNGGTVAVFSFRASFLFEPEVLRPSSSI
ncbi:PilN domain-containing protein [Patescibacteria group bacterium]